MSMSTPFKEHDSHVNVIKVFRRKTVPETELREFMKASVVVAFYPCMLIVNLTYAHFDGQ